MGVYTVVTPPASLKLTTLANAKEELNVTTSADDSYIGRLIDRASGVIASECGWTLGVRTVSETYRFGWQPGVGPSSQQVAPYGTPLNAQFKPLILTFSPAPVIVSVTENGAALALDGTDFEIDVSALLYRLRGGLRSFWGVPVVAAVYKAGFVLPNDSPVAGVSPLPSDVESVCLALITAAYTSRGFDPRVQMDLTEGVGRTVYQRGGSILNMAVDDAMRDALAPYRIVA